MAEEISIARIRNFLSNVRDLITQINSSLRTLCNELQALKDDKKTKEKTFHFRVSKFRNILLKCHKSLILQLGLLEKYILNLQGFPQFSDKVRLIAQLEVDRDKLDQLKRTINISQSVEMAGEGPFMFTVNNVLKELNTFSAGIQPTEKHLQKAIVALAA